MDIERLKERIFTYGKAQGFEDMEIYYQRNSEFTCKVFQGEIDDYATSQEGGLSFRGIYNGKAGYAYTEKIDESAVEILIEAAKENAEIIENEDKEIIFEGSKVYHNLDLYAEKLSTFSVDHKLNFVKTMEKEAYDLDPRVISVNYCVYTDMENEVQLYNTKGLSKSQKSNFALAYISAVVKENEEVQNALMFRAGRDIENFDPKVLAKKSVERARSYLGAKPVESKKYTILLENTAAADLLATFSGIFSADNVQKGRSLLKNKLGAAIGSKKLTIIDDALLANGGASRSFDNEGVASKKLTLVENGVLKSLLYNLKTAEKDGVISTGHGYKSSYKGTITVAPSNLYIEPGESTYEDLVGSLAEGLIITELNGLHSGANPVSGDFSLAARGYYVKAGKIERPVNQITIASNFYEMLQNIEEIGSDLELGLPMGAYVSSPTLKIKEISVAGE